MKAVILAGGKGTRISEESQYKPKPMIDIGGMPMIWHIMKELSFYGINEFIICAGYKQEYIKKWFSDYFYYTSDITFDFTGAKNNTIVLNQLHEPWKVTVVDTGLETATAGRIKRIEKYLNPNESFLMTYGDGVGNVNISEIVNQHNMSNELVTVTLYNFSQNKGVVEVGEDNVITSFREKSSSDSSWINAGYMIIHPQALNYIKDDSESFEKDVLPQLVDNKQVNAYYHKGFWQCVDTLREKNILEEYWNSGNAPWKIWRN